MKKMTSRIAAVLMAALMMFSLSACSAQTEAMMDFLRNGWDGVYEEKEEVERVWPNPAVRTHEIRENHKVTTVKNKVDASGKSYNSNSVAATDGVD